MAILRAGPWGNLISPHEDVPDDTTVDSYYYPINCALNDWPNQTWASFTITDSGFSSAPDETYATADLGESVSRTGDGMPIVQFFFCYQATNEFSINFNWAFTGDITNNYPNLSWSYSTIDGQSDSYFDTPANSGTETIVLPATTLGIVHTYVQGYLFNFLQEMTTTASLSAP
jgi:hypothetical protein